MGTGTLGGLDDPFGRLVEYTVILGLQADADLLFRHINLPMQ
jgi:hypothetical protein